jgi:hypothetical protein
VNPVSRRSRVHPLTRSFVPVGLALLVFTGCGGPPPNPALKAIKKAVYDLNGSMIVDEETGVVKRLIFGAKTTSVQAVEVLKQLPDVREVDFTGTRAEDLVMDAVAGHPELEHLNLSGARVSDQGMARLAPLTRLKALTLTDTAISDVGLRHVAALPALVELNLLGTKVTAEQVELLKKDRPELKIQR